MKLKLKIKFTKPNPETGKKTDTISLDRNDVGDPDDLIQQAEETLYDKYGCSFRYSEDFDITNYSELCEELVDSYDE